MTTPGIYITVILPNQRAVWKEIHIVSDLPGGEWLEEMKYQVHNGVDEIFQKLIKEL